MSFLAWDIQDDCMDSLIELNLAYGCPYTLLSNGYTMKQWDFATKSDSTPDRWGFFAPEARPDHTVAELRTVLIDGFDETEDRPEGWMPPEE